ncbi:mechanosensitive ion channel family protein [Sphingorhabdus sp.]|uniref:mechanosensitive ion channel family protein n=1 Tax=Sphingorhabdus sp. TaxID=1902408 RepID=UPI003983233E
MPYINELWQSLAFSELVVVAAVVIVAVLLGIAAASLIRRYLKTRIELFEPGSFVARAPKLARAAVAAIVLVAFTQLRGTDQSASLMHATALGLAVAGLVYQIARALDASAKVSVAISLLILLLVGAGSLGGLRPLSSGLDSARFTAGTTTISLLDVISAIAIVLLLLVIARALIGVTSRWIGSISGFDPSQRVLFQKIAQIAVVTVAIFLGIDVLGIDLTALAVFSGAFGLAIGFGLQKTFGNLISGLILLMDRSIKPGDIIVVGDTFGWVNKIGVRAVSVLTRDGKEHLIPNERLMTEEVENWSYSSRDVRVHVGFSVSYESDLRLVQKLAVEAAIGAPRVLAKPDAVCWIKSFGDSGVEFDLRIWIDDPEAGVGNIVSEVFLLIWDAFKANGISMPYPQRDIHVRSLPSDIDPPKVEPRS